MKQLIQFIKDIYISIAPNYFKQRTFNDLNNFTWNDIGKKNIEAELLLLEFLLQKDSIFFDIGANVGEYIHMASKTIPYKNIYAFEPSDWPNKRLNKIFAKANINKVAVSNATGISKFKIPINDNIEIHTRGTLKIDFIDTIEDNYIIFETPTITLNDFCNNKHFECVDLIKIDVEGFENMVIEGAKEVLIMFKPTLIIEIEQRHYTYPIDKIVDSLTHLNYECFYFDTNTIQLTEFKNFDPEIHQSKENHSLNKFYINNFIFINADSKSAKSAKELSNFILKNRF